MFPGEEPSEISKKVVSKAITGGINTLFVYAYNPVFGASYQTEYPFTRVEEGFGRLNILRFLSIEAKKIGIKVVACVPVNNFKSLWDVKPAWRAKNINGTDYLPAENMYMLSASHPEFRSWLFGFYKDLITRNPYIDGIEIVEPFIDYKWQKESDYNPVANAKFKRLFPLGTLGDENWLKFRADAMTELIILMNTAAHLYNKRSFLVHTWPAAANAKLFSTQDIKDHIGLDIEGILQLKGGLGLDFLSAELIWQQWAAEFGTENFNPRWTQQAAADFISQVNSNTKALVHVEVTPFRSASGKIITPTAEEFSETLLAISEFNVGFDVYDFSQIENGSLWGELRSFF